MYLGSSQPDDALVLLVFCRTAIAGLACATSQGVIMISDSSKARWAKNPKFPSLKD